MGWFDTDIRYDDDGWWCGGICWESLRMAQIRQLEMTEPTVINVTSDGSVVRHTKPRKDFYGLGVEEWFEVNGRRFRHRVDALNYLKKGRGGN